MTTAVIVALLLIAAFLFSRYVWFLRDPPRSAPVVSIKQDVAATIEDLVRAGETVLVR